MPIDKILWPGKPATEEQIAAFENLEGVSLPAGYREFLKTYNGGRPIPDAFPYGVDDGSLLNTFYELGEGEGETCDLQTKCDRYRRRIPHTMMPIGCDAGNNIVLLGVHGEHYGRVYFLDQMNPRPIFEIAPSFDAFLDSFEPRPEVDVTHEWAERSGASGNEGTGGPNQPEGLSPGKRTLAETVHLPHAPSVPANAPPGVGGPGGVPQLPSALPAGFEGLVSDRPAGPNPLGAGEQAGLGKIGQRVVNEASTSTDGVAGAGIGASAGRRLARYPLQGDMAGELASSDLEALGRRLGTQVQLDEHLRTGVEVVLHIDEASDLVSILAIQAGRLALAADVLSHETTIKLLQRYNEAWGQFRRRFGELVALISGSTVVRPGSEAWNARMDAEKIRRIASSRRRALVVHAPTGALEEILSDEIAFLHEQAEVFEAVVAEAQG